jgi:hypothetical protein
MNAYDDDGDFGPLQLATGNWQLATGNWQLPQQQRDGMMLIFGRGVVLLLGLDKCAPKTKRRDIFLAVWVNIYNSP